MNSWSAQQLQALDLVGRWIKNPTKPYFQLAGFAGTGKTTLAKHLAESVSGDVYFAAYTGKAAHVLTKSGARNVSTIHKLIYVPKNKSQERLNLLRDEKTKLMKENPTPMTQLEKVEGAIKKEIENLSRPMFQLNLESVVNKAALIVVDEYSMIDKQMGEDLLSFGCPVLALGDPGQLPPVRGASYFNGTPDFLLTDIHRQAQDNPIIWMSKEVREGRKLKIGKYGESEVIGYGSIKREDLANRILSADQLLVGKNTTRVNSNNRIRGLKNFSNPYPVKGDKLVCLRNNSEFNLLNGQIWDCLLDSVENDKGFLDLVLTNDDDKQLTVSAHKGHFVGEKINFWVGKEAEEFDYGYALTVHKSQGSQWSNLVLLDEWYMKSREEWLYTGITRAADKITIVQM